MLVDNNTSKSVKKVKISGEYHVEQETSSDNLEDRNTIIDFKLK